VKFVQRTLHLYLLTQLQKTKKTFDEAVDSAGEQAELPVHGTTYSVWASKVPSEGKSSLFSVPTPSS